MPKKNRFLTLILVLLLLMLSCIMGTLAWSSMGQTALNELLGRGDPPVPVQLIKLERQEGDSQEEIRIEGTSFYLFTEDGTQLGTKYVTDENGEINVNLKSGKYYFEEATPSVGYTYDKKDGESVKQYPFTVIQNQTDPVIVKAYNLRLTGSLQIRKTVENSDDSALSAVQKNMAFTFTVTFSDKGTYTYRIDGKDPQKLESGDTLKLCSGQTAVFENIPTGVLYSVKETPVEGYVTSSTGHRGNITEETSVADFVNRCNLDELGKIVVSKEVKGADSDIRKETEFTFTAKFGDEEQTFKLKHGETKVFAGIPEGTVYTIEEEEPEDPSFSATVEKYTGRVYSTETIQLPFVNIYDETPPTDKTGSLTVSKKVVGDNADPNLEFSFEVIFTGANAPDSQSFVLKSGEEKTLEDIPHGVTYTVYETDTCGYWAYTDLVSGSVVGDENAHVTITNMKPDQETGSLTITKEVRGQDADQEKAFSFSVEVDGVTESFKLKHGESKTITGLLVGSSYKVKEVDVENDNYIPTVKQYEGTIAEAEALILPFVNIYDPDPEGKKGSLEVKKVVTGENGDPDEEFTFEVSFEGKDAPVTEIFNLKAGENKLIENIPYGVTYVVKETDSGDCDPAVKEAAGVIAGEETAVITFVNKAPDKPKNYVNLTVTKKLSGEIIPSDKKKSFDMILYVDDEPIEFSLKADESKTFEVPEGAVYEVTEENYYHQYFSQFITGGYGIVTDEDIEAVVENTYVGIPLVEIQGSKKWVLNGNDVELPESITVQLKDGKLLVEEKTVTAGEDGKWKYTFIAQKNDADGNPIKYTIEEKPISSYITKYDGNNITNTYVKPISVNPPIITKVVKGKNAPKTKFEFVFKGKNGAPMPEGSVGSKKTVTVTGAGTVEVGEITFTDPGKYVYTIYETNDKIKGWTYDNAKYTITINVTGKDGKLTYTSSIRKNETSAAKVTFTNTYDKSILGDNVIVAGRKTWNHGYNPTHNQPRTLLIKLYADGRQVMQKQITARDDWKYAFEVPKYDEDGKKIAYTIDEETIAGYKKVVDGYDLYNTYTGTSDTPGTDVPPGTDDKPGTSGKPGTPGTDGTTGTGTTPGDGSSSGSTGSSVPGTSGEDAPDTGDYNSITVWITILICCITVIAGRWIYGRKPATRKEK